MPVITQDDVINAYNQYLNRNPTRAEINQHTGQTVPNIAQAAYNFFMGAPPPAAEEGGGFEFEWPEFNFGGGELSEQEIRHFDLIDRQIQQQMDITNAENARVQARRGELGKQIKAKYGIGLEAFEAEEAFRAAKTSRAQGERLDKALAGELPVDPGLERQITEDEATVRGKLLEQIGTGYETSTPGIQSLADFRQRAEELRSAARHDEIAAGIAPSAATAQFGLSMIGSESPQDSTSVAQALQASVGSRQATIQANQVRAQAMLAMAEMAQRERLAQLQADLDRQRMSMSYANSRGSGSQGSADRTILSGGGTGRAAGNVAGAVLPYVFNQGRSSRRVDPFST